MRGSEFSHAFSSNSWGGGLRSGRAAFTLIEVLIATAIFAAVLAAMNTVFYGALRLRKTTTDALQKAVPLNHALDLIRRDLKSMVAPGEGLSGTLMGGRQSSLQGQSRARSMNEFIFLQFHTATGAPDDSTLLNGAVSGLRGEPYPWPEIQKVAYYLRDPLVSTNPLGRELVRAVTRNLLSVSEVIPVEEPLLDGVDALQFLFFDGMVWKDSWNSTNELAAVPEAIKVLVELVPENQNELLRQPPFELVVPIVVQPRTNQVSEAESGSENSEGEGNSGGGGNQNPGSQPQPPPSGGGAPGGGAPGGGGGGARPGGAR